MDRNSGPTLFNGLKKFSRSHLCFYVHPSTLPHAGDNGVDNVVQGFPPKETRNSSVTAIKWDVPAWFPIPIDVTTQED